VYELHSCVIIEEKEQNQSSQVNQIL